MYQVLNAAGKPFLVFISFYNNTLCFQLNSISNYNLYYLCRPFLKFLFMKIKKIILDNIRCFDHLEIDFTGDNGPKDWIVVLGDNSVGKSALL